MNRQIVRVSWVAMGLLVALVLATTYWQTWARPALGARQDNEIQRVAEFEIRRGPIVNDPSESSADDNGAVLARNVAREVGRKTLYFRRYPQGKLTAHVVGYSTVGRARAGLERSMNDVLTGSNRSLGSLVDQTLDELGGKAIVGDAVVTTLDVNAQQVALDQLGRRCGAVAAVDPRTGRLLVMASSPSYDPNYVENRFGEISSITADCTPASPLLNRASAGLYPPGSTFKVVTASAALESHKFTPESEFYDPGYCIAYGKRVNNFDTSSPFGNLSLATALEHSVNSVFCKIGQALGAKRILRTAEKFGFYERPPLETPPDERLPSGLYKGGSLWFPERNRDVDAGRMAFGQERLLVTPLQMAMVAGAIGNAGILMKPYVVDRIVSPKGGTLDRTKPERIDRAVSPRTARDVSEMMVSVVRGGTGTAASLPGFRVGGKTGTAETGVAGRNTTWFIAFAGPYGERPHVAIAVVLQNQTLTGGATAAPIARAVMEAILRPSSNP
jgi:penicillin-binding protein A